MRGYFSPLVKDDYKKGYEVGRAADSPFEFTVTITADDIDQMVRDSSHMSRLEGTVVAPALSATPLTVREGWFSLFARDPDRALTRKMNYGMPMTTSDGKAFYMEGFKTIHDDLGPDLWSDTTTLYITLHEGRDANGPVLGKGIVKIEVADFKKQLASMEAVNAKSPAEALRAVAKLGEFFTGVLSEIYGGIFAQSSIFNPSAPPRPQRKPRLGEPDVHFVNTRDGVRLRLTRYEGGRKGPVMLSPGFGTSSLAWTIDTTEQNLPEFLYERGYDVWTFDYRASPALPSASTQFSLDDIALYDYPAAVDTVRSVSGADDVQMVAHCVGSLTLLMSMTAGLEGIRSVVSSQLTLHPVGPTLNEIKAGLYLASFLSTLGVDTLNTDFDTESDWQDRVYDTLLRLYPTQQRCNSPVCRRILFMYGEVYKHEQLNDATHDALHEMFGISNMTTFKQISLMLRKGHAVSAEGEEVYLPNIHRLRLPMAFIHGAENRLFLPRGSQETFKLLSEKNGPDYYVRHVIPDYAHMDCFIGKNANRDVYPLVVAELDKHSWPQGPSASRAP
ncbi:hypothetical protein JY651_32825 [Pyxidicoccus parkwayensis]|uniref:AB hydrolase-1 domain-containing protein n=1 Tax=Pyxidicoccus parkwayensis TaxID=2813578 RepID=A0ABX7NMG9_9BACT|nr:alpha/beta fold hydrolase [Pyxidicoccus parkwaysis]QSQ20039.1 hypothetical protein JY651_32825 [Pyxidicoccus parkwaysis]